MMKLLLWGSLACYSVGLIQALVMLVRKQTIEWKTTQWILALGFFAHTGSLVLRGIEVGRCPLLLQQEVCSFLAWSVMAYYLGTKYWYRSQALVSFVMPVVFILTLAGLLLPSSESVPFALRLGQRPTLLFLHIALFLFAYGAFIITFLAGLMYIIQERSLKQKRFGSLWFKLPSLDTCDDMSYKSVGIGFVLLTLGIVTGIVSSRHIDGLYWHGDPSEFLALATWCVYLFMVHCRLTAGWRGRRAALLSIAGFVMTLVSLGGVGYFSGFHFE
ncbi:MAG: cytochrome c biogenesis protein [Blastocatellia bacterium]|nr:cytochrome c biogenesis protein [Blastocatellia bacterium]